MKKIFAWVCTATLALSLTACSAQSSSAAPSASAAPQRDYTQIITDARDADLNEAYNVIAATDGGTPTLTHNPLNLPESDFQSGIDMATMVLGLDTTLVSDYAFSVSLMNVSAYAVGIFMPTEGNAEALTKDLNFYVESQQQSFENYLMDQYDIAKNAVLETVPSGEVILVMCENAQEVADAIKTALKA